MILDALPQIPAGQGVEKNENQTTSSIFTRAEYGSQIVSITLPP